MIVVKILHRSSNSLHYYFELLVIVTAYAAKVCRRMFFSCLKVKGSTYYISYVRSQPN